MDQLTKRKRFVGLTRQSVLGIRFNLEPLKPLLWMSVDTPRVTLLFTFPTKNASLGDSLFALGCGKMFEGTASQFWKSLKGLRDLPDDTVVYCAHEYTASNAKFALSVEPNNQDLVDRVSIVKAKRARGEPTVPTILGEEKKANPFLRVDFSEEIRKNIGVTETDSDAEAFGKLRKAKDNF
jgi:hydroxyacylglutathione hydrolase